MQPLMDALDNLLFWVVGIAIFGGVMSLLWPHLSDKVKMSLIVVVFAGLVIWFAGAAIISAIGVESMVRLLLTLFCAALAFRIVYVGVVESEFAVPSTVCAICALLGVGYIAISQWPPSLSAVIWTCLLLLVGPMAGAHFGRQAVEKVAYEERRREDAARNAEYERRRKAELAERAEYRRLESEKEAARRRNEYEIKKRREEEVLEAERAARAEAQALEARRQERLKEDEAEARRRATLLDQSLGTPGRVARQTRVLEAVFDASEGSPGRRVGLGQLADRVGLAPGQVLNLLHGLKEQQYALVYSDSRRLEWSQQEASITARGVKRVHDLHTKGGKVKYDVSITGPVGGVGIGDNPNVHDNVGAGSKEILDAVGALIAVVRRQSELLEDSRQVDALEEEVAELECAPREKQGPIVARLYSMAKLLGAVGVPILDAADKVKQLVS